MTSDEFTWSDFITTAVVVLAMVSVLSTALIAFEYKSQVSVEVSGHKYVMKGRPAETFIEAIKEFK